MLWRHPVSKRDKVIEILIWRQVEWDRTYDCIFSREVRRNKRQHERVLGSCLVTPVSEPRKASKYTSSELCPGERNIAGRNFVSYLLLWLYIYVCTYKFIISLFLFFGVDRVAPRQLMVFSSIIMNRGGKWVSDSTRNICLRIRGQDDWRGVDTDSSLFLAYI